MRAIGFLSVVTTVLIFSFPLADALAGELGRNRLNTGMKLILAVSFGLIFAATGKALGVFPDDIFSMMVIVFMFTTILPPPILNAVLKRPETA